MSVAPAPTSSRLAEAVDRLTSPKTIGVIGIVAGVVAFWLALPPWTLRDIAPPIAARPSASLPPRTTLAIAATASGRSTKPAVYLNPIASPAATPASSHQRNRPSSQTRTEPTIDSATGASTPTSVTAIRE